MRNIFIPSELIELIKSFYKKKRRKIFFDYQTVNRNLISQLFYQLEFSRKELNNAFRIKLNGKDILSKSILIDNADKEESFIIMRMAEEKGIIKFSRN